MKHLPSLVMPILMTSYLSVGMFLITELAELSETSCSLETPPKSTRTFFFITNLRYGKMFCKNGRPKDGLYAENATAKLAAA
jgi:hypothetical protein